MAYAIEFWITSEYSSTKGIDITNILYYPEIVHEKVHIEIIYFILAAITYRRIDAWSSERLSRYTDDLEDSE